MKNKSSHISSDPTAGATTYDHLPVVAWTPGPERPMDSRGVPQHLRVPFCKKTNPAGAHFAKAQLDTYSCSSIAVEQLQTINKMRQTNTKVHNLPQTLMLVAATYFLFGHGMDSGGW